VMSTAARGQSILYLQCADAGLGCSSRPFRT